MSEQQRGTAAGRDLWNERHPVRSDDDQDDDQQSETDTGMNRGRQLWLRRKAGSTFALGAEPAPVDVTPAGDAA